MSANTVWCIGRNFDEHARELGNPISRGEPLVFLKPASSLRNVPIEFVLPAESHDVQPEVEVVFRISRSIASALIAEEAWSAVDAWAVGIDWTARDLQNSAKSKGQPWVRAKGFRHAASLGPWQMIESGGARSLWNELNLGLTVDGVVRQSAPLANAVFSLSEILVSLSQWTDLAVGDVIFTGTPAGVSTVQAGSTLDAWAEAQCASGSVRSAISLKTRSA